MMLLGPGPDALGGGPTHVRHLLSSPLSQLYHLAHFQVGSRGRESPSSEEPLAAQALRLATSPLRLAWAIAQQWPAVVHVNASLNAKSFWRDAVYVVVGRALGRRVVYQIHGGSVAQFCDRGPLMRAFCRALFRLTHAVVVISVLQRDQFAALFGDNGLALIPNAVDLRQFRGRVPPPRPGAAGALRLLFLGRLVAEKGIFELIDAMHALRDDPSLSGATLTVAGSGPASEELARRVERLGLEARVRLVGPVQGATKSELLRESDVLVLPSYHEGLPYSVLEALASGLPVIATRVGGIPDLVTDGVHGFLVEPRSVEDLARAVRTIARDAALRERMSARCVAAREHYSLERLSRQFDALYSALIDGGGRRPRVERSWRTTR